jgi:hypothetical protein
LWKSTFHYSYRFVFRTFLLQSLMKSTPLDHFK